MRIFVTGATGYIGRAVAEELARAGHEVFGMTRTEEKAKSLSQREIIPVVCSMADESFLARYVQGCDTIIHCAAEHGQDALAVDRRAVETLLGLCRDQESRRTFVYTSGVWLYGDTGRDVVTEDSILNPLKFLEPRRETEKFVLSHEAPGLRTFVIRPGCVYGGGGGLTASWFESAQNEGAVTVVGAGENRWTMVHVEDLARLYRLAIESSCSGEIFNGTDRSRFTVRECAEAASRILGMDERVETIDPESAKKQWGRAVEGLLLNQHVDSSKAARLLDWHPRFNGFVDSVARHHHAWQAAA